MSGGKEEKSVTREEGKEINIGEDGVERAPWDAQDADQVTPVGEERVRRTEFVQNALAG